MKIAYMRVSTVDQKFDRQLLGMKFDRTFEEKVSGKSKDRPQLQSMLGMIREDDEIHVHELSRLGRNTKDLLEIVEEVLSKGASIKFYKENLEFISGRQQSPLQNLMLTMLSAISQFERELTLERIREGIAIAKAKGHYKGKQSKFSKDDIAQIKIEFTTAKNKSEVARKWKISRGYLYRLVA